MISKENLSKPYLDMALCKYILHLLFVFLLYLIWSPILLFTQSVIPIYILPLIEFVNLYTTNLPLNFLNLFRLVQSIKFSKFSILQIYKIYLIFAIARSASL